MGWAMVTPEAVPDIIAICFSGKHGMELCQALISVMRPYDGHFPAASLTIEQAGEWMSVGASSKKTTARRAIKEAMETGALVRICKGKKGTASVYTFRAYVHNLERGNVNETDGIGSQTGVIGTQSGVDSFTNDPPYVHNPEREDVDYPYSSISIHTHPQVGGSSKEGDNGMTSPTGEEWSAYCKERGYIADPYEYGKLSMRGFTDSNGEPIKDWRAYVDRAHRNDRPEHDGAAPTRGTAQCPECGRHVTVTRQGDGTFAGGCQYCCNPVTATEEQLIKR